MDGRPWCVKMLWGTLLCMYMWIHSSIDYCFALHELALLDYLLFFRFLKFILERVGVGVGGGAEGEENPKQTPR